MNKRKIIKKQLQPKKTPKRNNNTKEQEKKCGWRNIFRLFERFNMHLKCAKINCMHSIARSAIYCTTYRCYKYHVFVARNARLLWFYVGWLNNIIRPIVGGIGFVYGVERSGKIMCEFMWFRIIYIHLIIREKIKTSQVVDRNIPTNPRMYPKTGSRNGLIWSFAQCRAIYLVNLHMIITQKWFNRVKQKAIQSIWFVEERIFAKIWSNQSKTTTISEI